jgi:hypothetical protein
MAANRFMDFTTPLLGVRGKIGDGRICVKYYLKLLDGSIIAKGVSLGYLIAALSAVSSTG